MTNSYLQIERPAINAFRPIRVYLDMDGLLADFDQEMAERSVSANVLKMCPGAYQALPPYPGAIQGVQDLIDLGFDVYIATKIPNENILAATEKLYWVRKHLPALLKKVIITPDKGCLGGVCDVLVDDRPHKAKVFEFMGTVVHFGPQGAIKNWSELIGFFKQLRSTIHDVPDGCSHFVLNQGRPVFLKWGESHPAAWMAYDPDAGDWIAQSRSPKIHGQTPRDLSEFAGFVTDRSHALWDEDGLSAVPRPVPQPTRRLTR